MNKDKKSFILHADSLNILDELSDDQAGKLFKLIRLYQEKNGDFKLPKDTSLWLKMAFKPIENQFIRDNQKWAKETAKRAEAGKKGGLAKASNAKKSVANLGDNVNVNVNESVNVNVNERGSDIPPPPFFNFNHYMDVLDYLKENGENNKSISVEFENKLVKVSTLGKAYVSEIGSSFDLDRQTETRFLTYLMNNTKLLMA